MSQKKISRKDFLKISGTAAGGLTLAGCELNSIPPKEKPSLELGPDPAPDDYAVYIGSGDTALFNYIYILEQLEAAFFTRVMENPYTGMEAEEERILLDIQQHEIAHRDYLKAFLGENGIQQLHFEFFATNFDDRRSVLRSASLIEDIMVSMYNRTVQLFENLSYIPPLIKIASVESRHAAAMRVLLKPRSSYFAGNGIISPNGLDIINAHYDVINIIFPYVIENVDFRDFPEE